MPESLDAPAFPGRMALPGQEVINDNQPPAGRKRACRGGEESGRFSEVDKGLYCEGEVEKGQAREARKVRRNE
jgi:hypothetical protein